MKSSINDATRQQCRGQIAEEFCTRLSAHHSAREKTAPEQDQNHHAGDRCRRDNGSLRTQGQRTQRGEDMANSPRSASVGVGDAGRIEPNRRDSASGRQRDKTRAAS